MQGMNFFKSLLIPALLVVSVSLATAADEDGTFTINIQGPDERPTAPAAVATQSNARASETPRRRTAQNAAANAQTRSPARTPNTAAATSGSNRAAAASERSNVPQATYSVGPRDTLWSIATRYLPPDRSVNEFQIAAAIYRRNPSAFIDGNVNRLRAGPIVIPSLKDIARENTREGSRLLQDGRAALSPLPSQSGTNLPTAIPVASNGTTTAQNSKADAANAGSAAKAGTATDLPSYQATENLIRNARMERQKELENEARAQINNTNNVNDNGVSADPMTNAASMASRVANGEDKGESVENTAESAVPQGQNSQEENKSKDAQTAKSPLAAPENVDSQALQIMLEGAQKQIDLRMREINSKLMATLDRLQKSNDTVSEQTSAAVSGLAKQYDGLIADLQQSVTELKGQVASLSRDNSNMREMLLATDDKLESIQVSMADGKVATQTDKGNTYRNSFYYLLAGVACLTLLLLVLFSIVKLKSRARSRALQNDLSDIDTEVVDHDEELLSSTVGLDEETMQKDWSEALAEVDPDAKRDQAKQADSQSMLQKAVQGETSADRAEAAAAVAAGERESASEEEIRSAAENKEADVVNAEERDAKQTQSAEESESQASPQDTGSSNEDSTEDVWAAALKEQAAAEEKQKNEAKAPSHSDPKVDEDEESSVSPDDELAKYIGKSGSEWAQNVKDAEDTPVDPAEYMPEKKATEEQPKLKEQDLADAWAQALAQQKGDEKEYSPDEGKSQELNEGKDESLPKNDASAAQTAQAPDAKNEEDASISSDQTNFAQVLNSIQESDQQKNEIPGSADEDLLPKAEELSFDASSDASQNDEEKSEDERILSEVLGEINHREPSYVEDAKAAEDFDVSEPQSLEGSGDTAGAFSVDNKDTGDEASFDESSFIEGLKSYAGADGSNGKPDGYNTQALEESGLKSDHAQTEAEEDEGGILAQVKDLISHDTQEMPGLAPNDHESYEDEQTTNERQTFDRVLNTITQDAVQQLKSEQDAEVDPDDYVDETDEAESAEEKSASDQEMFSSVPSDLKHASDEVESLEPADSVNSDEISKSYAQSNTESTDEEDDADPELDHEVFSSVLNDLKDAADKDEASDHSDKVNSDEASKSYAQSNTESTEAEDDADPELDHEVFSSVLNDLQHAADQDDVAEHNDSAMSDEGVASSDHEIFASVLNDLQDEKATLDHEEDHADEAQDLSFKLKDMAAAQDERGAENTNTAEEIPSESVSPRDHENNSYDHKEEQEAILGNADEIDEAGAPEQSSDDLNAVHDKQTDKQGLSEQEQDEPDEIAKLHDEISSDGGEQDVGNRDLQDQEIADTSTDDQPPADHDESKNDEGSDQLQASAQEDVSGQEAQLSDTAPISESREDESLSADPKPAKAQDMLSSEDTASEPDLDATASDQEFSAPEHTPVEPHSSSSDDEALSSSVSSDQADSTSSAEERGLEANSADLKQESLHGKHEEGAADGHNAYFEDESPLTGANEDWKIPDEAEFGVDTSDDEKLSLPEHELFNDHDILQSYENDAYVPDEGWSPDRKEESNAGSYAPFTWKVPEDDEFDVTGEDHSSKSSVQDEAKDDAKDDSLATDHAKTSASAKPTTSEPVTRDELSYLESAPANDDAPLKAQGTKEGAEDESLSLPDLGSATEAAGHPNESAIMSMLSEGLGEKELNDEVGRIDESVAGQVKGELSDDDIVRMLTDHDPKIGTASADDATSPRKS